MRNVQEGTKHRVFFVLLNYATQNCPHARNLQEKKVQKEIIPRVIKQFPVSHSKLGEVGRFTGVSHSDRGRDLLDEQPQDRFPAEPTS